VATPDQSEIFKELEATQLAYRDLVTSLSEADWTRPSLNPDFDNRELVWHIAWSMTWLAHGAVAAKAQRRPLISRLPGGLMDPLRRIAMRRLARGATAERALQKYEEGQAALLHPRRAVEPRNRAIWRDAVVGVALSTASVAFQGTQS